MKRPEVLVVDDKENMLKLLERILGETYTVVTACDGTEALALLGTRTFDLVLTDIKMPGADGFEILGAVKKRTPETEVVMMTAYSSIARAVEAIKGGAYDYLPKPFDPDEVLLLVARALERKLLLDQTRTLRKELSAAQGFQGFIGRSPKIAQIYALLEQAARLDITVLITGQSGTGKELVARAIHLQSARTARRFVAVNCGALPTELVESELFGHAKGSFTGATVAKPGLFEEAQGGTIFFDEIGDLPLAVQVKLNRALQEHEIRRVGENTAVRIDVRVIAATHSDLKAEVAAGRFREDLFYRLNVFPIELPPLCERRDDIPLLALHFLQKHTQTYQRQLEGFEPAALRALGGYHWPGNVRQLENAVERAVAVATERLIRPVDLPKELQGNMSSELPLELLAKLPFKEALESARDRVSQEYLSALMQEFQGNVTHAAERARMERGSLHRLLKRYGIHSNTFKGAGQEASKETDEDDEG